MGQLEATAQVAPALIRAYCLFAPLTVAALLWLRRRPDVRLGAAVLLATLWQLAPLLALHLLAQHLGWWEFDAQGGMFHGFPVDIWLGWAVAWGAVPALLRSRVPLWGIAAALVALDVFAMPAAAPVVRLHHGWLLGEALGLACCMVPGVLLARWTAEDRRLPARAALQAVCFAALFLGVLTAIILERTGGRWETLSQRSTHHLAVATQLLAIPAAVGLSALQEFVTRGGGTPLPYDAPRRLVTSGPYAYVANPMQVVMVLLFLGWGALLGSAWVAAAALMSAAYGAGIAAWDERNDLEQRFGAEWRAYRRGVRHWWPRWRPWVPPTHRPANATTSEARHAASATLYLAETCALCRDTRGTLEALRPVGLRFAPAESFPGLTPARMIYIGAEDGYRVTGVAALARALEHVHLGWALVGWCLRLPGVCQLAQILVDALGGGPRRVDSYTERLWQKGTTHAEQGSAR
jgi:protein-S-isoprenylcysteine O-methyltransferase Ste14